MVDISIRITQHMLQRSFKAASRFSRPCKHLSLYVPSVSRHMCTAPDAEVLNPVSTTPVTHDFKIVDTTEYPTWPMFQMMDLYGAQVPEAPTIECSEEEAVEMYTVMARLKALDDVFYNAQVSLSCGSVVRYCALFFVQFLVVVLHCAHLLNTHLFNFNPARHPAPRSHFFLYASRG